MSGTEKGGEGSKGGVTLTVRIIRSFQHSNLRHMVFHHVDLDTKVADFKAMVNAAIVNNSTLPPPFRKYTYDTMKISHKPFGAKTSDPLINRDRDEELILRDESTLAQAGVEHETELSYFKLEDYREYQRNPHTVF